MLDLRTSCTCRLTQGALGLLLAISLSACNGCDDNTVGGGSSGSLDVRSRVVFTKAKKGMTKVEELTLTNIGQGTLNISNISLTEFTSKDMAGSDDESEFFVGNKWISKTSLASNESVTLSLEWTPLNTTADVGQVVIMSNDPDKDSAGFVVEVESLELGPDIFSPPVISIQNVPVGDTRTHKSFIQNNGESPLQLKDVILPTQDIEFKVSFPDPEHPDDESKDRPSSAHPRIIEPGQIVPIRISFAPQNASPSSTNLTLYSNDPDSKEYTVRITGNAGAPCIDISAKSVDKDNMSSDEETHFLDFSLAQIDHDNHKTVQIKNCNNTEDLIVRSISMLDDGGGLFNLTALPGTLPDDELVIAGNDSETFVVTYTPTDQMLSKGYVEILSNDPVQSALKMKVQGKGTDNACPIAQAEGGVVGESTSSSQISTIPNKTIKFSAKNSIDPDGSVDTYEWNIIQKPPLSTSRLAPSNTDKEPTLLIDIAGDYVVELAVFDDVGQRSCETAQVFIQAIPDEDIHIQLTWTTPADAVETDNHGTDLDLHYLHPNGRFGDDDYFYDIHYNQKTADWGIKQNNTDDPSLDVDDTDGAGPENINHNKPKRGLTYRVGVDYFKDNGYAASYATVVIYIQGVEKFRTPPKYMAHEGFFWNVASITWPSQQILSIDKLTEGFPQQ